MSEPSVVPSKLDRAKAHCSSNAVDRGAARVGSAVLGVLDHDAARPLERVSRGARLSVDINVEALLSTSTSLLGGTLRPAIGATINTVGATSHAYLDARWQYEIPSGFLLGIGIGGAVHDGQLQFEDADRKELGSRMLFHIPWK